MSLCFQLLWAQLDYTLVIYTWIFEKMAPEILPYVSFSCEILLFYLFIYLFFFFCIFFCSKSIRKKYKGSLADIYKLKIFFSPPPPPPSLPPCFANLAPLSLKRLLTAQRFGFEFGARSEIRTKSLDLAFRLASWSKVFLRTSLSLMREQVLRVQRPASSNMLPI